MQWNAAAEIIAALVVLVIFINSRFTHSMPSPREKLFRLILIYSLLSFFLNIISVITIYYYYLFSRLFIYIINSSYFIFYPLITQLFILYIILYIYEQVPKESKSQQRVIFRIIGITTSFYILFVIFDIFNGLIFYLDESNQYHRGVFNGIPIVLSAFHIIVASYVSFIKRKHLDAPFFQAAIFATVLSLSTVTLQLVFPNVLLTGSAFAITTLIFYLNFQTTKLSIDSVTLYPNKDTFLANVSTISKKKEANTIFVVALDNYNRIRETIDQRRANQLLKNVADKLNLIGAGGQVYRYKDDELALIVKAENEKKVAKKIVELFSKTWEINGISTCLSASTAVLKLPLINNSTTDITILLDNALATSTKFAHHDFIVCDIAILNTIKRKNTIVEALLNNSCDSLFSIVYQPIFSLETNTLYEAEALLRMEVDSVGSVSPDEFIPLAEKLGVIDKLGLWVIEEVLKYLSSLKAEGIEIPKISINFSAQQFLTHNLVGKIRTLLKKYKIKGDSLAFELTESALIESSFDKIIAIIKSLKELGIEFHLDDFGSGYSNLSLILSLPIKFIKIDKSLLWEIQGGARREKLLQSLIEVTQKVGFNVVVEGVENSSQLQFLKDAGCQMAQGYFLSPPLKEAEFKQFLINKAPYSYLDTP
ncbi:MAG: GGDEF domain-containing phosphodiesterase [Sphaerochaetaceae bacterium]